MNVFLKLLPAMAAFCAASRATCRWCSCRSSWSTPVLSLLGLSLDELEMLCLGGGDDLEARVARVYLSVSLWVDHGESVP